MNILQSAALLNPILSLRSRSLFKIISMNFSLCSPVRAEKVVRPLFLAPRSLTWTCRILLTRPPLAAFQLKRIRLFNMRNKMRGTYQAGNCYKTAPKVSLARKNSLCFAWCGAIKLLCSKFEFTWAALIIFSQFARDAI